MLAENIQLQFTAAIRLYEIFSCINFRKLCQFAKYFCIVLCSRQHRITQNLKTSHRLRYSANLQLNYHLNTHDVVGIRVCSADGCVKRAGRCLCFLFFNFLSQQSITLVLFLAISDIDFLHTQDRKRKKKAELCTETSEKDRCMTLETLKSILLPIIFVGQLR